MAETNRLMIFSGNVRREGWKTLDCNHTCGAHFKGVIPPLPMSVKAVEWDEIEWIHGITSVYPWVAAELLAELRKVIKPGGKLTLEQPDFLIAAQRPEWIFGDPQFQNPLHMNHWGYTPLSLSRALSAAGFSRVDMLPAQHHIPERDFRAEAYP